MGRDLTLLMIENSSADFENYSQALETCESPEMKANLVRKIEVKLIMNSWKLM
jgi:hypothetical protein